MPNIIRTRISRFKRWEDAHASLLGKHLLLHALSFQKKDISLSDLKYTEYGRPYFLGNLDFNISHSGNMVICAFTTKGRIGIDIEERKPVTIFDFKNQFSNREWHNIKDEVYPFHTFYDYWTKKEAVLKADGRGVSVPLNHIDVSNLTKITLDNQSWYFTKIDIFHGYSCNISFNINIKQNDYNLQFVDFESNGKKKLNGL